MSEAAGKSRQAFAVLLFRFCGALVLFYASSAFPAQDPSYTQFGNILFKVPNGWNPVEKDSSMYIVAPGLLPGQGVFIALTANDLQGDLQTSASQVWIGFQKAYRMLQAGRLTPMHSDKGYDGYYTTAIGFDQNRVRWSIYFMAAQYGKRIEVVAFLSNLPPGVSYDAYFRVFQNFLSNLSFGDSLTGSNLPPVNGNGAAALNAQGGESQPPPEPDQPSPAGVLQGVFVCLSSGIQPTNKQYIFYPDGYVMYGLPQDGMRDFDFDHYRSQDNKNRNLYGRYRVDGDQVKIVWQNQFADPAHPAVIKINTTAAHPPVDFGWDVFIPMCRCTGKKFSGTYRWGAPAADQYIQFSSDGTFLDHRVLDQMLIPSPFYEHPRIQRGTYSIQNQTIVFNFADGHRGARTFLAPKVQENDPMFDWIGLGWQQLFEESYRMKLAAQP